MGHVIGIQGASGGLGASTLTIALGLAATARLRRVCAADTGRGGGLDVTAGIEHVEGLRWADLAQARGDLDGAALWPVLPTVGELALLSARGDGTRPTAEVRAAALAGLAEVADLVVVDLGVGRDGPSDLIPDLTILLVRTTVRGVADAAASRADWSPGRPPHLVVRGDPAVADPLADHLEAPVVACWADDSRIDLDADRGVAPGLGRARFADLTGAILDALEPIVAVPR